MIRTVVCLATVALLTASCSDATKQKLDTSLSKVGDLALKVKAAIPDACKKLDESKYDELVIAAVSLAVSELASPAAGVATNKILTASVQKFCEWNGVILNPTQQAEQ